VNNIKGNIDIRFGDHFDDFNLNWAFPVFVKLRLPVVNTGQWLMTRMMQKELKPCPALARARVS